MNLRSVLRIGIAATSLAAFAGIVVNAQTAPPEPSAAPAPADQSVAFVKPLFTEDFESGKINTDAWTVTTQPAAAAGAGAGRRAGGGRGRGGAAASTEHATVEIVQDKVAHGKNALHVHVPANVSSNRFAMLTMKLPEAVKTHLFGRVYMMISPKLSPSHTVLFFAGTDGWPNANFLEFGNDNGKDQPSIQQNDPATPPRTETTKHGTTLPTEKWFCVEWEMNDHPDVINTWIDGKPADSYTYSIPNEGDTDLIKGFTSFGIGARYWAGRPPNEAFDIYYDDLAIGTGRIGPIN